jgi:hypothetical protein
LQRRVVSLGRQIKHMLLVVRVVDFSVVVRLCMNTKIWTPKQNKPS